MRHLIVGLIVLFVVGCSAQPNAFNTSYSGVLELTEHVLGARIAGRVTSLSFAEGDLVKASQVIATLDRYEQAKKDYERTLKVLETGGVGAQAVEHAKLTMEDQQIIAPIDGIVLVKSAEVGEIVSPGAGIMVLGNLKEQWIKVFLPEKLIGQLHLEQKALIHVDGILKPYEGHISFIATKGEFTPRNLQSKEDRLTQAFAVKVMVDNPDESLHPGVSAELFFKE